MEKMDKGARETKKPTVQVQFHLLMSEQIVFNPKTQNVYVAFGEERLGGWESRTRKLECSYTETGAVNELTYIGKIPAEYITNERYLVYKYLLKSKNEDAVVWENYTKNGQSGADISRYIKISKSYKAKETWHQYDGYFECKPDKLTTFFWNWWNKTGIVHATNCVETFFPKLGYKEKKGISKFMHLLNMMLSGIERVYLTDGKCWHSPKDFEKFVSKQCMEVLRKRCTEIYDKEYTTILTLSTLLVLFENDVEYFSEPDLEFLCHNLNLTADRENNTCRELEAVGRYLNDKRPEIHKAIIKLATSILRNKKDPSWFYLMPWIHFLSGNSKPFEERPVRLDHDAAVPKWWGISSISEHLDGFKSQSWNIIPSDMVMRLVPLFEMDYLMPRTFLAATSLKDVQELVSCEIFPVEVCLANLLFHLKNRENKTEKSVRKCMDCLLQKLDKIFSKSTCPIAEAKMSYMISNQMILECVQKYYLDNETLCCCVQVFLRCVAVFERLKDEDDKSNPTHEIEAAVKHVAEWMRRKFDQYSSDKDCEHFLKVWNELCAQDNINMIEILDTWNKKLSNRLSIQFRSNVNNSRTKKTWFVNYYCKNVDSFNSCMQEQLSGIAFEAVKEGHEQKYSDFTAKENKKFGELLSKLFLTEWNNKFENESNNEEHMMVEFLLNWSAFSQYLTIYCNDVKRAEMLSEECIVKVALAASMVENLLETLLNGSITIDCLNLIKAKQNRLSDMIKLLQKTPEATLVTIAITVREREVEAFQELAKHVATLSTLCQSLRGVDKKEISSVMQRQSEINKCRVSDICKVETINEDFKLETFHPKTIGFETSSKVAETLPELRVCYESSTFCNIWYQKCREEVDSCKTLDDVLSNIWTPVKEWFETLARNIEAGEITFKQFEQQFGDKFQDDFAAMKKELANLNVKSSMIAMRLDQLCKYRQLETCVFGAKSILKFAEQYSMTGNFEKISAIASYEENDMQMKSFDESLIKLCESLHDVTHEQVECLQTFVDCSKLISWLKDSMKNAGLKELKVFVDLALMSAGEEPMNIARVQCLHTAVTGYAPLIFDLQKDAGFEELLELCKKVWKELDANPSLPDKLRDTTRHLQWLDNIQRAHGSVEVTSMKQADACNEHGEYTIGSNAWPEKRIIENATMSMLQVKNILKLTVPGDEEKRETRNYNIEQLQDLQSRLMLVAGNSDKGTESVEQFTMIFDGAVRLSNVYVKLCSAGCVLFKNWTAFFFCDPERPVCAIIEFGETESQLKGRRSDTEELRDIIPKLAGFMESCYDKWLDFIKEKRKKFPHLNYFTTDQLVILQRELVKIGTTDEPSHLIFPLLSAVKSNCTKADLHKALTEAKAELDGVIEEAQQNEQVVEEPVEDTNIGVEVDFINTLVDQGFSESLARKAFKHVGPDPSEGFSWCMENTETESNEEIDEPPENDALPAKETSTLPTYTRWNNSNESFLDIMTSRIKSMKKQRGEGSAPLLQDLTVIWTEFLESISSSIQDYLSLEHLGLILKHLAISDDNIVRKFPSNFEEGIPNLVVCRPSEILATTLSIYAYNSSQPLPHADEILMCTDKTSRDEVDIFWRRSLFDNGQKIHCLVNVDALRFDVCEPAEKMLEDYLLESRSLDLKYRLIVISNSETEHRSSLVTFLDKFKRTALPVKKDIIRNYLKEKLACQSNDVNGVKPASSVDKERSTVRVVKSWRAGVGKSLFKLRREEDLEKLNPGHVVSTSVSISLQDKAVNTHYTAQRLLEHTSKPEEMTARLFHIDIAREVQNGVDNLLFNLLVLGCLSNDEGFVWRKSITDLYLIETLPLMIHSSSKKEKNLTYLHQIFDILPDMTCRSPRESLDLMIAGKTPELDQLFDEKQCKNDVFQRPYQYLIKDMRVGFIYNQTGTKGCEKEVLQTMLRHCGLQNPSWAELFYFVNFLNTQLISFESNVFVSGALAGDLPGFGQFVLSFLLHMSKDFSTHSLDMSENTPGLTESKEDPDQNEDDVLNQFQLRRTWESSPHPYLFFNEDKMTFTFLGFHIDKGTRNVIDHQTKTVLEKNIMSAQLYQALELNGAPLQENFDAQSRKEKIQRLRNVMGINETHDPDDTYELTTDNVKKMMAIHMRFRCDIPVIVMGETGCGKTRLVKFMCALQVPPKSTTQNMIIMKVHGGTTHNDIKRKVEQAQKIALDNMKVKKDMFTVLFFDEANTTESVGLIKEIMCDKSLEGRKLELCENLKMVAACNPYKKHSDDLIKKLEQAGLGYHVDADETNDCLGRVPMRRLVYRVQPLPQSLLPLVWDFGQLNSTVEKLYIKQMVRRYIESGNIPNTSNLKEVVSDILTESQMYMRQQKDECSFVSLRDVDRTLVVMSWFYKQSQENGTLFKLMDVKLEKKHKKSSLDATTRSLILALGVCYHACLKSRSEYRDRIAKSFKAPCQLQKGGQQIEDEIDSCQEVYLDNVHLEDTIACNLALKENVFMMAVCVELRVPLFLVGKPGSSKSLAKTIVSDAMQGNAAKYEIFKLLKHAQMVSFQCSPLSTPEGIVGTFRQCAQFQQGKDLDTFVSVVVLDEVGLAEDSPRMPLKTLHPLLEDGCQGDEEPEEYKKVGFIGISNWALDPAKMNRGILVQREVPDITELKNTASGICKTTKELDSLIEPLIEPMSKSYLDVFNKASQEMREFFGLRDFYSLVKMVFNFVDTSNQRPTWYEMVHSIKRNFDGLEAVNPVECFKAHLFDVMNIEQEPRRTDPDCTSAGLINACLFNTKRESRYLLLITETYGALSIIQQQILTGDTQNRPITIFGSSFPNDQEYTQVCRNINKIKLCMEAGRTVLLLNLENLYESLYDALNQYYVYFGGDRYVDLGLGTHRVKCTVHKNFRLIVVAEKKTVYKVFPIPLINRLEKHFMNINTMLSDSQQSLVTKLKEWTSEFAKTSQDDKAEKIPTGETFVGYHEDACSAVVLYVSEESKSTTEEMDEEDMENYILEKGKAMMLMCATPDAVFRLKWSDLPYGEQTDLSKLYFREQAHGSFVEFIEQQLLKEKCEQLFCQITTHSNLLGNVHKQDISKASGVEVSQILLIESLSSFDTEQQFTGKVQHHLKTHAEKPILVIIQCDSGHINANLIACARFCALDVFEKLRDDMKYPVHMILLVHLPRIAGGCFAGFQCGVWRSVHIDDLYPEDRNLPHFYEMQNRSVAQLLEAAVKSSQQHKDQEDNDYVSLERIKGLILECVQAALANVKDIDENKEREKERIELVMKLLFATDTDGEETHSFLYGVCCFIAKLLSEKEKINQYMIEPNEWMTKEAISSDKISEAGTFRRSCLKILQSKITPVLAGIIAFLDTNQNLDLCSDENVTWKTELWKAILYTPNVLEFKYSDLQSPTRTSDLQEAMVIYTGIGEQVFLSKMPFSWVFMSQINDVLLATKKVSNEEDTEKLYHRMLSLLKEIPICMFLENIHEEEIVNAGLKEYINDFVCSVYHNGMKEEHQVVCNALGRRATSIYKDFTGSSLLSAVVCVHLAYDDIAQGMSYFRLINSIWSNCSNQILALEVKEPGHTLLKCNNITLTAAHLLCEHLSPEMLDEKTNRPNQLKLGDSSKRTEWLGKVEQYRPVLEKTLCFLGQHSHFNIAELNHIRSQWERIIVMKLFVEHICLTRDEKTYVQFCMPLWSQLKKLKDDENMKMIKPINTLENFMKLINNKHMKDLLGDAKTCSQCERKLDSVPVQLPCGDLVCKGCFQGLKNRDRRCFTCKEVFPEHWEPTEENQNLKEKEIAILKGYQKKCNAFFMDMVSQLSFSDNSAPSPEVIEKLFSFITFDSPNEGDVLQTKVMSIFDTGIDPTPVFRSFLLQLLLRTSMDDVTTHLDNYLQKANGIIEKHGIDRTDAGEELKRLNTKQYVELCLMVIQCLEDNFYKESDSAKDEVEYAAEALQSVKTTLDEDGLSVEKLVCLAKARMGLSVTAKYLNISIEETAQIQPKVEALFEAAKSICETESKWPTIFLVKIISRCYGLDQYFKMCSSDNDLYNWVSLPQADTNDVRVVADRYMVCGEDYLRLRNVVTDVILGSDIADLGTLFQTLGPANLRTALFLDLAIHREITCSYVFPEGKSQVTKKNIEVFEGFFTKSLDQKLSNLPIKELHNKILPEQLKVEENLDIFTQGLQCLLVHYLSVLSKLDADKTLLQPLRSLPLDTNLYKTAFLPTMPQDDTDEVRAMLLKDIDKNDPYKQINLYKCPNGHIYLITRCGKPNAVSKCLDCGCEIGGRSHVSSPLNKRDDNEDETKPGHILGPPEKRAVIPLPEREMTPMFCACVRLLLHMSMYLGSSNDLEGICNMIQPKVEKKDVSTFLWEHIKVDIRCLENALGKSKDDVLLFLHAVVDSLMKIHLKGVGIGAAQDICLLTSKATRKEWEIKFTKTYLQQSFNEIEVLLNTFNESISGDERLGGNPLLCLMHETKNVSDTAEDLQRLHEVARVWRFRTPISLQHMTNEFKAAENTDANQCKILQIFLKEECHLRALRFVPGILRLQRALLKTYLRKLDRSEGNTITLKQIEDENTAGQDTKSMIKDFTDAWELVRISLKKYVCRTDKGGVVVPEQLCDMSITEMTPVAVLLPTIKGLGLCSFALLDFLLRNVQNGFLDNYLKETKRKYSSILKVKPKELTSAHLICYDPQQDLLSLILANCQYTFEMGKGTTVQYDFQGLEKQIIDRFLLSKSRIDVGPVLQIDMMVYRTEVTNSAVFEKLEQKIPQAPLTAAWKTQISGEIRAYTDLCESLVNMDITISFLKSTGGDEKQNLHEFMKKVLKMHTTIASRTAQQMCEFQHCKKLWLHLSLMKSQMMAENKKAMSSIFEIVKHNYHENLQPEMSDMLVRHLRDCTIEKLVPFVDVLHEYILLFVAKEENVNDEDYIDIKDKSLQEYFWVYIDTYLEEDDTENVLSMAEALPGEILNRHCVPLWMMAYNILREKQTGERRV